MIVGGMNSSRSSLALVLMATTLSFIRTAPAAEFCATGAAGSAVSCDAASQLAQELLRGRMDRTLADDPAANRTNRLTASATAPSGTAVAPFAMSSDGGNTSFNTSLTQWSAALSAAEIETLKQAQAASGEDAVLPRVAKTPPPQFDLWAQGHSQRLSDAGALPKMGNAVTTYVGADYRLHRNVLIGGMVQFDDSRQSILMAPDSA